MTYNWSVGTLLLIDHYLLSLTFQTVFFTQLIAHWPDLYLFSVVTKTLWKTIWKHWYNQGKCSALHSLQPQSHNVFIAMKTQFGLWNLCWLYPVTFFSFSFICLEKASTRIISIILPGSEVDSSICLIKWFWSCLLSGASRIRNQVIKIK